MEPTERVTNDYANWTQSGDKAWELSGGDGNARITSTDDTRYVCVIEKSFELSGRARLATLTVQGRRYKVLGEFPNHGYAGTMVSLKDPDGTWHLLYNQWGVGDGSLITFLSLDISSFLSKAGTYYLRFVASVGASRDNGTWTDAYVQFGDVSLMALTLWELTFEYLAPATESFVSGMTLLEPAPATEYFTIARTVPYAATDKKLLCAKTDSKVYEFEEGTPEGIFDTRDEDFGLPGQEKTLSEIHLSSSAEAPHTVSVYVSTDAGLTWTPYGERVISKGVIGLIFPWVTKEAFTVRFKGDGLHLDSFTLYAIPRGQEAPVSD